MLLALLALSRTKYAGPMMKKIYGGARVVAYGMVISTGLGLYTARNAAAEFREQGLKVGANLAELTDLLGDTDEIRINNQSVFVSSAESDEPVGMVLDRFAANCDAHPGAMKDLVNDVVAKNAPVQDLDSKTKTLTTQRQEAPDHTSGTVMCMAGGDGGKLSWKDAVRAFSETGDISNIGNLRYVFAQKNKKKGTTNIRTIWTEGHFNFYDVMPPDQSVDAPGSDAPLVPRPDHARRAFTAEAVNNQYAARYYDTDQAPADAIAAYDSKMEKLGWQTIAGVEHDINSDEPDKLRWYMNAETGQQMVFMAANDMPGAKTYLIVATMGNVDMKAPVATTVSQ